MKFIYKVEFKGRSGSRYDSSQFGYPFLGNSPRLNRSIIQPLPQV